MKNQVKSFTSETLTNGRTGFLHLSSGQTISTPRLFPVVSLVTSTTARGGGIWKYILQANGKDSLLLRSDISLMSQVLHFLDFIPKKIKGVERWRDLGIKECYSLDNSINCTNSIFLDSGGFKLLWNQKIDLSAYGLSMSSHQSAASILNLQKDFGGDLIATLDYPLPPRLVKEEAIDRMKKSISNAVKTARLLEKISDYDPFLFVAAHGQDRESMSWYVSEVFKRFKQQGLQSNPLGLAIGSLVPLRGAHKYTRIVDIIRGLQENIPEEKKSQTPIHVFGVTGSMIPILIYLGIDSFDSSSYVQETRSLCYLDPVTRHPIPILEMEELPCNCRICQSANLRHIQEALTSTVRGRPVHHGHYKSKYYADIALHNLEMDFNLVDESKQALESGELPDYLRKHTENFPKLRLLLEAIAEEDDKLRVKLTRNSVLISKQREDPQEEQTVSLKHTPDDFNILSNGYQPLDNKRVLLLLPCSVDKPYSQSRSHRIVMERLQEAIGDRVNLLQKVTISGLYGPVPEEYERHEAVMGYDFKLDPLNTAQIDRVVDRVVQYLQRYGDRYAACVGYATSRAYRTVLEEVVKGLSKISRDPHGNSQSFVELAVFPVKPKARRLTEFFRQTNIAELIDRVELILQDL